MTHPWSADTVQFGSSNFCNSMGTDTVELKIPGCPASCDSVISLSVPPPLIIDLCGDTVTGLSPKIITINPVPVATANPVTICSGEPVNINVSSCVAGSSFTWTGSNGSSGNGNIIDNSVNTGPATINYSISVSAGGCTGSVANVSAEVYPVYSVPESAQICSGTSIFLQGNYQTTAGTYFDTLITLDGCDSLIVTNLTVAVNYNTASAEICEVQYIFLQGSSQFAPGTYYDTLTTAGGCDSVIATGLIVYPLPQISANPDFTVNSGDTSQLSASGGINYLWSTDDTATTISISPSSTTIYTVTGTDSNDCSSSDMVTVTVVEIPTMQSISVPNIFTPNGDNENDFIFVHGSGISEFYFAVYDRLGEKIFETNDKSVGWDGTRKGKPLNSAVFAYILTATFKDGTEFKEKGNITLVK